MGGWVIFMLIGTSGAAPAAGGGGSNLDERVYPLDVQPIEIIGRMPEGRNILPLLAAILADEL